MVFSNKATNKSKLSEDRWKIFKISKDFDNLEEKGQGCGKSKEKDFHASMDEYYVFECSVSGY